LFSEPNVQLLLHIHACDEMGDCSSRHVAVECTV
jgi:hypothetical protein